MPHDSKPKTYTWQDAKGCLQFPADLSPEMFIRKLRDGDEDDWGFLEPVNLDDLREGEEAEAEAELREE